MGPPKPYDQFTYVTAGTPIPTDVGEVVEIQWAWLICGINIDEITRMFDLEVSKLTQRRDEVLAQWVDQRQVAQDKIEAGHRRMWAAGAAPQTWELPYGTSKIGKEPSGRTRIMNMDAFMAFVEERLPVAMIPPVLTDPDVNISSFRKLVTSPETEANSSVPFVIKGTDEIVPGAMLEVGERSYTLKEA